MNIEKMREEFEAWANGKWPNRSLNLCGEDYPSAIGQYVDWETELSWRAWQASHESLASDLRDAYQKGWDASGEGWNAEYPGDLHEKDNWKLARDESLGLRKNAHL